MQIGFSPAAISFISEFNKLKGISKINKLKQERIKIAAKEYEKKELSYIDIWKLLFLHFQGIKVKEMDFIKACGSKDIHVKRTAYQGILAIRDSKSACMLLNTLSQDLESSEYYSLAIHFIGNFSNSKTFIEIFSKIKSPTEDSKDIQAYLVADAKIYGRFKFSLFSQKDIVVFTKMQILLDYNGFHQLKTNDINFLKELIYVTKCRYTILKILQCYRYICKAGLYSINEKLFNFLKSLFNNTDSKSLKQIDMAITIEACKLLIETGHFSERAECFVIRMIKSENPNSRHIGFKFAQEYGILTDVVVDNIIKFGTHLFNYLNILLKLIDESNYKKIYKKREEIVHCMLKNNATSYEVDDVMVSLLAKIAEISDLGLLCKIIIENPKVYRLIQKDRLILSNTAKPLLRNILYKEDMDYFWIIYDIIPSNLTNDNVIPLLASKHLKVLIDNIHSEEALDLIDRLIDILLFHGPGITNRKILIDEYSKAIKDGISKVLIEKIRSGILLFNLILNSKVIEIHPGYFVEYKIVNNFLEISYNNEIGDFRVYDNNRVLIKYENIPGEKISTIKVPFQGLGSHIYLGIKSNNIYKLN